MTTSREMTDKEKVLGVYPDAYAAFHSHQVPSWLIRQGKRFLPVNAVRFDTEEQAWADAASKLPDAAPSVEQPKWIQFPCPMRRWWSGSRQRSTAAQSAPVRSFAMCAASRLPWLALIAGLTLEPLSTFAQSELAEMCMTLSAPVHERTPSMSQESKPTPTVVPDAKGEAIAVVDQENPNYARFRKPSNAESKSLPSEPQPTDLGYAIAENCRLRRTISELESQLSQLAAKPSEPAGGERQTRAPKPPSDDKVKAMAVCDTSAALSGDAPEITMSDVGTLARHYLYLKSAAKAEKVEESPDGFNEGVEAAAHMLETDGVLLSIDPHETKSDRIHRFALAMARKIRELKKRSVGGVE